MGRFLITVMPDQPPATSTDFRIAVGGFPESEYRVALFKIIEKHGLSFVGNTPDSDARDYRSIIRDGVAYVGLLGQKYGPIPEVRELNPNRLSIVDLEFNEALKLNRPVVMFINEASTAKGDFEPDAERRKKLAALRSRAKQLKGDEGRFHVSFRGRSDFEEKASAAIARLRDFLIQTLKASTEQQQDIDSVPLRESSSQAPSGETESMRPQSPQQTAGTEKRLVFFSASHEDYGWRDRLKSALDSLNAEVEVEWWDDSKIVTGSKGLEEIDAAIGRASVAVVLLSPAYLNSETATNELNRLLKRASSGRLRLFPIMLHRSPWNAMPPAVRDLQIWSIAKPVGELRGTAATRELNKIAESIVQAAREFGKSGSTISPGAPATEPTFSAEATKLLEEASALATKSDRAGITTSCLLFALTELAGEKKNTARFVRDTLDRNGGYAQAFQTFLTDSDNSSRQSESQIHGSEVKASKNVMAILETAASITSRVSRGAPEIFPRHIFAAMLVTPQGQTQPIALRRIKSLGIDLEQLGRDFVEFLRANAQSDDHAGWAAILTSKGFQGGPAGYTSEFCGVGGTGPIEDQLGVKDWAEQLADLIALRETKLPLAIGLFGNWGSGKSHFMNLIDRRLKWLMDQEKEHENGNGRWCSEIVPVYFNAWHYLDANLWASLIAQIFESLFVHLRPKQNDLEKVQQLLENASGAAARAAEEVIVAETATKQAQRELIAAEQSRLQQETVMDGLLEGLRKLLPSTQELQKHAVELLGVEKEIKSIEDVREVVNEAQSLAGRAQAVWNSLWKKPGRRWRLAWLSGAILGGAVIAAIATKYLPATQVKLLQIGRQIATVLAAITPFVLWFRPLLAAASSRLKQMEDWANSAQAEQERLRETSAVKQARLNVTEAAAKEDAAKIHLAEAKEREERLKEDAKNLSPERKLGRFIEQRAQSMDYRGQLGLVSLARRDFQELSDIFANSEALKDKIAKLEAKKTKESNAEAAQIQELSRSVDRIVLFVDDLDRCQPEKVVDVLQAVHLLLAFPLFAVVVGVDQRALRQSLRMQFKGLLTHENGSENGAHGGPAIDKGGDERPATPLDYLEKIFHVPFHLPPMGDKGFEKLIDRLSEPSEVKANAKAGGLEKIDETQKVDVPAVKTGPEEIKPDPALQEEIVKDISNENVPSADEKKDADVKQVVQKSPPPPEVIGSVPLQRWEREALRAYHPLIQTPRGATRLLNTYRLVRAGVPQSEWDSFSGAGAADGEFRVAMLLLAAAAGYPAVARDWFERLISNTPSELFLEDDGLDVDPAWRQFKKVYDATFAHITTPVTKDLFVKWVDRVERFAF